VLVSVDDRAVIAAHARAIGRSKSMIIDPTR
jgi:hypothetical protein